ncbi:ABC transporter ATP-binding protein [Gordonia shandongensis]|uniref:ABC transporter ATP-binding protein n=1 Tax=Gordonia shandongensis TaxID=376351 RepID=UPI0004168B53|nr:ABC transporter ATP-binding protein [Gordonia shandongensis]
MSGAVGTIRRLVGPGVYASVVFAVLAAAGTVAIPTVLAKITDLVFVGAIGARLPDGVTLPEAATQLRDSGDGSLANVVETSGAVPGQGIDWDALVLWTIIACLLIAGVFAARATGGLILNARVADAVRRLRSRVDAKLYRLPVGEVTGGRRGRVLAMATADIDNIATVVGPIFVQLPVVLLSILTVAVALLVISWFFALIVFIAIPVTAVVAGFVVRRAQPHMTAMWQVNAELTADVEDSFSARDMIVAYEAQDVRNAQFAEINGRLARSMKISQRWSGAAGPLLTLCNALVFVAIAVLGALQMLEGAITLGALQAVVLYAQQLSSQTTELASMLPRIQSGLVSLRRVRTFLDQPDEQSPAVDDDPVVPSGRHAAPPTIVFDDVRFAYDDGAPVIDGVTLHVHPGETLALVGATGSGKTTLTTLLTRFADPDSGRILVDGEDVADWSRSQIRSMTAVVTQEPWLMSGTAGENIALGAPDGDIPPLPVVADILASLPNGARTEVSDDDERLSAGEKQMITVARALAARPRILILDEATSAADPHSELLIARGLDELRRRTTTIVVTHRISTLSLADRVAVLDGGRIVECGPAADLAAAGGVFARRYGGLDVSGAGSN